MIPVRESPLVVMVRAPLQAAGVSGAEVKDASLPALALLRALHALSRHWHTLYRAACLPDHRPLVQNADFINAKVRFDATSIYQRYTGVRLRLHQDGSAFARLLFNLFEEPCDPFETLKRYCVF